MNNSIEKTIQDFIVSEEYHADFFEKNRELEINLWIKDKQGRYCASNDYHTKNHGLSHEKDLLTLCDYDLWPKDSKELKNNDHVVLQTQKTKLFFEAMLDKTKKTEVFISVKKPLYSQQKTLLGTIGLSIAMSDKPQIFNWMKSLPFEYKPFKPFPPLPPRQKECLRYLTQGLSAKEIAKMMGISTRTVEHHIENMKKRLNCKKRSELFSAQS